MSIKQIAFNDLPKLKIHEGLILRGCGGETQEWLDGINSLFTAEGILRNGCEFKDVYVFSFEKATCILFPFNGIDLNIGKLSIWRIATRRVFFGIWLSDFMDHHFSNEDIDKPDCALIGEDGNIFNLLSIAARTLREHGKSDKAEEMSKRVTEAESYTAALAIISEYVNITSVDDSDYE